MEIRTFEIKDLEQVTYLLNDYRIFYNKDSDIESCKKFLQERYNNKESQIFVAEQSNKIIGFVQIYPVFSTVNLQKAYILNDLYVSEAGRGSGAGTQLIEKTFEYAKENDAKYVTLETGVDNTTAQKLYKKMKMSIDDSVYHFSKSF